MRSRQCTHRVCLDRVRRLLGGERGAAFAEYTPLLALIALVVIFALAFLGPAIADTFSDPFGGPPKGDCPNPSGEWTLVHAGPLKKNDIDVDVSGNQDGWYCTKSGMGNGNGNGNTGNNQNVKDNNVGPGSGNGN